MADPWSQAGTKTLCRASLHVTVQALQPLDAVLTPWSFPGVDGVGKDKGHIGGQSSVTKVVGRSWWDPTETAATPGEELKRIQGSRDKCDRMSWRH